MAKNNDSHFDSDILKREQNRSFWPASKTVCVKEITATHTSLSTAQHGIDSIICEGAILQQGL